MESSLLDYQINIGFVKLDEVINRFEPLTFPSLKRKLINRRITEPLLSIVAVKDRKACGLLLLELKADARRATVISFFIGPKHRNISLGSTLMKEALDYCKQEKYPNFELTYQSNWKQKNYLQRMLNDFHFEEPRLKMLLCKAHIEDYQKAPWINKSTLPDPYSLESWDVLTDKNIIEINEIMKSEDFLPEMNPFQIPEQMEKQLCFILMCQDTIAGWWISHRIDDQTVQRTCFYIHPLYRKLDLALSFSAAALTEQKKSRFPFFIFQMGADNKEMMTYFRRNLEPYQKEITEIYLVKKILDKKGNKE